LKKRGYQKPVGEINHPLVNEALEAFVAPRNKESLPPPSAPRPSLFDVWIRIPPIKRSVTAKWIITNTILIAFLSRPI